MQSLKVRTKLFGFLSANHLKMYPPATLDAFLTCFDFTNWTNIDQYLGEDNSVSD